MHNNYIETSKLVSTEHSSQQISFPYGNALDRYRRGKSWRTAGYWVVASGSNTLKFKESNASSLTATIVAGTYQTTGLFLAAIKTALEVAGDSTYTVNQDTATKKIKITSNGLGGDGIFQLLLTDPASAGIAALVGFAVSANLTGSLTYTADVLRIHSFEYAIWDMGVSSRPEAFILLSAGNKNLNLSPAAVIKLQGNATNTWNTPQVDIVLPYDPKALFMIKPGGINPIACRYWRLYLEDKTNIDGYLEINAIFLGEAFAPVEGAVQFPFDSRDVDPSEMTFTDSRQVFVNKKQNFEQFSLNWYGLSSQDRENLLYIYRLYGIGNPFFVCYDANGAFTTGAASVKLAFFSSDLTHQLASPRVHGVSMEMQESI